MRLLDRLRGIPAPGTVYDGPAAYFDAAEAAILGIVPGQHAIGIDGRPLYRLVIVDDSPEDANDGAFHYEVAAKGDPIARPAYPVSPWPAPGRSPDGEPLLVELEPEPVVGRAGVSDVRRPRDWGNQ